jgi:hypothetical protein
MTHKRWILGVLIFACTLLLVSSTFGQGAGANLSGTVRDSQGLIVPNAMVIATNEATGVARERYTNEAGIFVFNSLLPGKYTVSSEVKGFKKAEVTGFVLEVATTKTLDFKFVIGGSTETVTVTAESIQQIQTTSSDIGDLVVEKKIQDIPLNGRMPIELALMQPGLAGNNKQSGGGGVYLGGLSTNGARSHANALAMDGADITSGELGTGGLGLNLATDILLPVDAIEEFRVITANPSAEFGRVAGFQVKISTKSGTNQLHGSVYEFYRDTFMNANSFFNNAGSTPIGRPPLHRNQFGASIGGPLKIPGLYNGKNRTFFFFNYEGTRQAESISASRTVLTNEARNGLYRFITSGVTKNPDTGAALTSNSRVVVDSSGQIRAGVQGVQSLDLIKADKQYFDGIGADTTGTAKKFLDATPLPNDFTLTGDGLNTAGFRWNPNATSKNDLFTFKFDHTINKAHSISLRGNIGRMDRIDSTNNRYAPFPGGYARWRYEDQSGFSLTLQSNLTPTVYHEFHIGLSHNARSFATTANEPGTLAIGVPSSATSLVSSLGITQPFPTYEFQKSPRQTLTIGNSLTWIKGRHFLKSGFEFRSTPLNQIRNTNRIDVDYTSSATTGAPVTVPQLLGNPSGSNPVPAANVTAATDLFNELTGRIGTATAYFNAISEDAFGPIGSTKERGFRQRDWGFFFQDDWKASKKLTLNLGLRYDFFQVPWEVNSMYCLTKNRPLIDTQLDPTLPYTPVSFGRVGPKFGTQMFKNDLNNFGPAIGFSWDPGGNNKTAIRGSYRISYDKIYSNALDYIEQYAPGLNATNTLSGTQLAALYPLTNASGQARTPRLADLKNSLTQAGDKVGNGTINLASALDIRSTLKPLQTPPTTRSSGTPTDYDKNLVNPYSQSWSIGIQREIMRNTMIEVRYVGRKGTHEFAGVSANQFRAPADILSGLRTLQGLLKMTNADAYAKAGIALPSGVSPTALVTISQVYGSAPSAATSMSQYTPGALASLAPQALYKIFLAGNSTFDSTIETYLRTSNLPSTLAQFDNTQSFQTNAFLTSAGLNPVPTGTSSQGWMPLAVGLVNNTFRPNLQWVSPGPATVTSAFNSNYRGLQVQFNRRFYKGLDIQANYTYSLNRDVTSTTMPLGVNTTDYFNPAADYGRSANDVTHDFKANSIYELPFGPGKRFLSTQNGLMGKLVGGWQFSTIFEMASSYPFSITYASQSTSLGGGSRPDFVSGATKDYAISKNGYVRPDSQGKLIYFTLDDFAGMFQGAQLGNVGNVPKNVLNGPKYWDVTLSVVKNVHITETKSLQLRGEFFNLFNHANMGDPNTNLESASFGQITYTRGDPRIIQLAFKLNF